MRVYIAAPLFNESELERNRQLRDFLQGLGYDTYLPQEDGGISYDLIRQGNDVAETRQRIFSSDMAEVQRCDIILCVLDGRVPDEGVCVELGAGYALQKTCIGYLTDRRSLDQYGPSLMIEGCLSETAHSQEELREVLSRYI